MKKRNHDEIENEMTDMQEIIDEELSKQELKRRTRALKASNDEMTSFEFREMMMTSLLLWGNAYARKIRKNGHVTELWYLKPQLMTVERDTQTGKIKYTYSDDITNQTC